MRTDPDKCDPDVFESGTIIEIRALSKTEAEGRLKWLRTKFPTWRIDWHYAAGHAVFRALPAQLKAPDNGARVTE